MKTHEARAIADRITAGIHFPGGAGGGWHAVAAEAAGTRWYSDLLSRIAILVGTERVEYASGYVDTDGGVHGEIVVLTGSTIIRADFSTVRTPASALLSLDATVAATSRSTIASVSVTSVTAIGDEADEDWPRQVGAVVTTDDGRTFRLPLIKREASFPETDTAAIISSLLRH
jgi:hypothetical protein